METEKYRSPNPVQKKLSGVKGERDFSDSTKAAAFVPSPKRSETNDYVKRRPRWEEQLRIDNVNNHFVKSHVGTSLTQFGGLNEGFSSCPYQEYSSVLVTKLPRNPPIFGRITATTHTKTGCLYQTIATTYE